MKYLLILLIILCGCGIKKDIIQINCSERVVANSFAYLRINPGSEIYVFHGPVIGEKAYHVQAWVKGKGWLDSKGLETYIMPYHQKHFTPKVKFTLRWWVEYKMGSWGE